MTHRLTALAALVMIFAAPVSIVRAQDHNHGDTVDCESRDMGKTRCHVSWNDARLVRQLSDTQCVRGENWGIDQRGLWVDRGCAGRFVASSGPVAPSISTGIRSHHALKMAIDACINPTLACNATASGLPVTLA